MSKQKSQVTTFALPVAGTESSSEGGNLIKKYLYHWPLFVLCAVIVLVAAYFYVKITSPIYPIVSTLEFKAPTASSASLTVNQSSTEQELDPINKPIIVENELEVMQSKKLIYQVVNELQLWASYTQKKGLKTIDLYKRSPVVFSFIKQTENVDPSGVQLKVNLIDENSFSVKDTNKVEQKYTFNTPIKSTFGTWQLRKTTEIGNYTGTSIDITVKDPDIVSDIYQKGIKVELENKDAPFVNLSTSDTNPQRGKDILNSLMNLYLQYAIEDKNKLSQKTLKFIDFRLDSLKNDLDSVERKIQEYKSSHGVTDIIAQAQSSRDINQANVKALNDINLQLGVVKVLEDYLASAQNVNKLPPAVTAFNDNSLNDIYDKLTDLVLKRKELLGTTPETNPIFESLDDQITTLRDAFSDKVKVIKTSLLAQKTELTSFKGNVDQFLKQVPDIDRQYGELSRYQESKVAIYKFLLEKHEQVALKYASSVSDAEIVDDAHAGQVKWPIPVLVFAFALILGLGIAAALLFIREIMNDLITSRKQIEESTETPILGELSYQETESQIVVSEGRSKFMIGEQFRVLRTNLYHLHGNSEGSRVTLFTSSVSGEGKSFVSSNLAVTLSYASKKTIILEMDLRKPKVSVNFGLSSEHPGISNYLNDETSDLKKLIQKTRFENLDVLGSGSILPNPSELLEKDRLDNLINALRELYDEIIIDSPPIHLVTDALVIARVADASLYVIRQSYTHKYELQFINEINESNRFPKFTIVLNGIRRDASGYGGYGYGYGYGYGGNNYYNSYSDKQKTTFADLMKSILDRF
ncbi:capsular exopolysaccharide synthesis family protein [Mucilaginibacter yixingensis]|uniref:non-specific protein-tyrosine kinase n=1 Tax=Mucilaginibacter yixingensis TaxID=1295612 RepID=A0A2T5JC27_9SPHI|nr:tyrosine-protein kinase [Mucilaginibacter yixingensis]PTQ99327.1 capsular exopolysaccharide synthesis family protein [Mucilaginibacter yixingensis]